MKVPVERYKVNIVCVDRTILKGVIFVDEGLRVNDFLNITKENFIAVTDAEFSNIGEMPFHLEREVLSKKKGTIILNKTSIKWLEDLGKYEE